MKKSFFVFAAIFAATAALAEDPVRTVVVRNGNVLVDDGPIAAKRAFVGVAITSLTPELREFFGASKDAGVLVSSVEADSPAAKAGIRVGDVIVAVDGKSLNHSGDLFMAMRGKHGGDNVRFDVVRAKNRQSFVAVAEEREAPELRRVFNLRDLPGEPGLPLPLADGDWNVRVVTPNLEELQMRIHDLEKRLQELEKLQKK